LVLGIQKPKLLQNTDSQNTEFTAEILTISKIKMGKGKDGTDAAAKHGRNTAVCAGLTICIAVITFIIGLAR